MNDFTLIDAQSPESRLAQIQLEELDNEKEFNCRESIFQSEMLIFNPNYSFTDFGW